MMELLISIKLNEMRRSISVISGLVLTLATMMACTDKETFEPTTADTAGNADAMHKPYWLERSGITGGWLWGCKDGSAGGEASSRSDARDAAQDACGEAYDITPPWVDLQFQNLTVASPLDGGGIGQTGDFTADFHLHGAGDYLGANIEDLDGASIYYEEADISLNEIKWWAGESFSHITDERKVVVLLTIMGIYNGGTTPADIQANHNLSPSDYTILVNRDFKATSELIVDDITGALTWNL